MFVFPRIPECRVSTMDMCWWSVQVSIWTLVVSADLDGSLSHLNGFVHLDFFPPRLELHQGHQALGYVNASTDLDSSYTSSYTGEDLQLHICCTKDDTIAVLDTEHQFVHLTNRSVLVFNVTVLGRRLGSTSIRFYVTRKVEVSHGTEAWTKETMTNYLSHVSSSTQNQHHGSLKNKEDIAKQWTKKELLEPTASLVSHSSAGINENQTASYTSIRTSGYNNSSTKLKEYSSIAESVNSTKGYSDAIQERNRRSTNSHTVHTVTSRDLAMANESDIWWLPMEYEVVVKNPSNKVGQYLVYLVMGLVAINMLGIGGQVDLEQTVYLVKRPLGITVTFVCRFGIIPAIGLGLVELLQPDRLVSLGILSLVCSPAEGASNLLILLLEGDLTFSATLTTVNNFAAVAMLPLWTILFETRIYSSAGNVKIPFREMFVVFGYMTSFLVLGLLFQRRLPKLYTKFWLYLPALTVFTLAMILCVDLYNSAYIFQLIHVHIFFLSLLVSASGFIFSAALSFITRLPLSSLLIVTMETGIRTSFIPGLIVQHSFQEPDGDIAKTTPVLCTFLCLLPTTIVVLGYRLKNKYRTRKYSEANPCIIEEIVSTPDHQGELLENGAPEVVDTKETAI